MRAGAWPGAAKLPNTTAREPQISTLTRRGQSLACVRCCSHPKRVPLDPRSDMRELTRAIHGPRDREEEAAEAGERPPRREWLVTNGLGGYAAGTVAGVMTRRYHGLLVASLPVPLGRTVMLNHLLERVRL